jgi:hypothetical protein
LTFAPLPESVGDPVPAGVDGVVDGVVGVGVGEPSVRGDAAAVGVAASPAVGGADAWGGAHRAAAERAGRVTHGHRLTPFLSSGRGTAARVNVLCQLLAVVLPRTVPAAS